MRRFLFSLCCVSFAAAAAAAPEKTSSSLAQGTPVASAGEPSQELQSPEGLPAWQAKTGDWGRDGQLIAGSGDLDNRLLFSAPVPEAMVWPVTIDLREGWSAGVLVMADSQGERGYAVRADAREGKLLLEKIGPWPEAEELAAWPWRPGDGARIPLQVVTGAGHIRVYWPEKSEYPVLEHLGAKPVGSHVGLQVIDATASFLAGKAEPTEAKKIEAHVPATAGPYTHIYNPGLGETEEWYINDHCFAQGPDGWHLYGITHAKPANPWDELNFAHGLSSEFPGTTETWKKQPYALKTDPAWGERHLWAPHVIKRGDTWYMFYCAGSLEGDASYRIHLATSTDLTNWVRHPANPMFKDTFHARDPMVLEDNGIYYMYYTANMGRGTSHHTVHVRTSTDLLNWSPASLAFVHPARGTGAGPTESPFVVKYGEHFYLLIGPAGDYHRTAVFRSPNPHYWEARAEVGHLPSHAAEVVRDGEGNWYVSDCGWDLNGVYLAPLTWNPQPATGGASPGGK